MKTVQQILTGILAISLMLTSSCTMQMWDATNTRERVFVSAKDVTEQQLIDKKIPYYKSQDALGDGYLIPQSTARKLGDYTIRFLAVPFTVTVDAAMAVTVVGIICVGSIAQQGGNSFSFPK